MWGMKYMQTLKWHYFWKNNNNRLPIEDSKGFNPLNILECHSKSSVTNERPPIKTKDYSEINIKP